MDDQRDIRLTLVQPQRQDDNEIIIDIPSIFVYIRRLFALWLALAVALGAIFGGIALFAANMKADRNATTIVRFTRSKDPNGNALDVTKLISPAVLTPALDRLGIDLMELEDIRDCFKITGIMSDEAKDQQKLYYDLFQKNGDLDTVDSLLEISYATSLYILSFDYNKAGFTQEEGIDIVNMVVAAYQDYYNETYSDNHPLTTTINVIDYHDYDYAEAASIFSDQLSQISSYLSSASSGSGASFRSSQTGYTFADLQRQASTLRDIELDELMSYIMINSVTANDIETEISYYQWRIENLEQSRAVQESRLASLTDQIALYQKDPVIYVTGEGNTPIAAASDMSNNYDSLIQDKLNTQASIADYTRTISYYESVIEGFREAETVEEKDKRTVEAYLDSLSAHVQRLAADVQTTAEEYYEKISLGDMLKIPVPGIVPPANNIYTDTAKIIVIVEAVLLLTYLAASVILGLRDANAEKKQ